MQKPGRIHQPGATPSISPAHHGLCAEWANACFQQLQRFLNTVVQLLCRFCVLGLLLWGFLHLLLLLL
jgi:hypothetical protein